MGTLTWRGDAIKQKVRASATLAVDKVMADSVDDARRNHPYTDQTGFETGSIRIEHPAVVEGDRITGVWGAFTNYSLFLEIGTSRIGPDAFAREREGHGDMWEIPPPAPPPGVPVTQPFTILPPGTMAGQEDWVTLQQPSVGVGPLMEPRPHLRPAADVNYPMLPAYIRLALAGRSLR